MLLIQQLAKEKTLRVFDFSVGSNGGFWDGGAVLSGLDSYVG